MANTYRIEAYSPSLNQRQQQIDLANQIDESMTHSQALQLAQSFADIKNREFAMHVCDWQPQVTPQEVGLHTISGSFKR
jgi:hypothetical protein